LYEYASNRIKFLLTLVIFIKFYKKFCAVRLQVPLSLPIYRLSESTVRNTVLKMRYKDAVYRLIMSV